MAYFLVDAKNIAKYGLDPELQASTMPHKLVMNLRNLTREYYSLSDDRSKQVIKLQGQLRIALPQFRGIFSSITGKASLMVLKTHTSLESLAHADAEVLALQISQASRKGITTARKKAEALMKAAEAAQTFGAGVETNFHLIRLSISLIEIYDEQIKGILKLMNDIVAVNKDEVFVKHIRLLETMKGIGFLSAVSLMCEIGDFAAWDMLGSKASGAVKNSSIAQKASESIRNSSAGRAIANSDFGRFVGGASSAIGKVNDSIAKHVHAPLAKGVGTIGESMSAGLNYAGYRNAGEMVGSLGGAANSYGDKKAHQGEINPKEAAAKLRSNEQDYMSNAMSKNIKKFDSLPEGKAKEYTEGAKNSFSSLNPSQQMGIVEGVVNETKNDHVSGYVKQQHLQPTEINFQETPS